MYFGLIVPAYGYAKVRLTFKASSPNTSAGMHSLHPASSEATDTLRSARNFTASHHGHAPLFLPW